MSSDFLKDKFLPDSVLNDGDYDGDQSMESSSPDSEGEPSELVRPDTSFVCTSESEGDDS